MYRVAVTLVISVALATSAHAETCEEEAVALRSHLETEAGRAWRWNYIWAALFGAAAVGQLAFAVAETDPLGGEFDQDTKETLYVGASKATIGVAARVILPLRIPVPAATGDLCSQVPALREALAEAGRRERRSFWLTHLGGTALNLAGAAILTYRRSLRVGAISFAISYPVGPASAYTQPRRSWRQWRDRRASWVVGASGSGEGASLWLGGEW
ncbi:MAG: hypothetical protein H0X17_14105 [Deltaproteobacteria bacterium]|nr:hypothetical protein [Deltaproteobacteria bacterium]